jgi:hypothetical protein
MALSFGLQFGSEGVKGSSRTRGPTMFAIVQSLPKPRPPEPELLSPGTWTALNTSPPRVETPCQYGATTRIRFL